MMDTDMKKVSSIAAALTASLLPFSTAFAQTTVDPCPQGSFNKLCSSFTAARFGPLVGTAIQFILVIAVVIAIIFLIWGGIKWITSGGDKAKVDSARGTIIAAVVGLIIAFAAYFIISIVLSLFGLGTINSLQLPSFSQ